MTSTPPTGRPPALLARLRQRYPWFDHLARAITRYIDYRGYHYAASITYFSVLSLVPLLMVAFSIAGFVLSGSPELLDQLRSTVFSVLPKSLNGVANGLIDSAVDHKVKVGVFGVLVAGYSGWNWMNALRDALTGMWDQVQPNLPLVRTVIKDLLALLQLGLALLICFGFTAIGGSLGGYLLRLAGLGDQEWAHILLSALSIVLALIANGLLFLWVLARLPREPVAVRDAISGAAIAAVGFELLKQAGNVYLQALGRSPIGIAFGSIVGILVFVYLIGRLLMLAAAWTATSRPRDTSPQPPAPAPAPAPVTLRHDVIGMRPDRLRIAAAFFGAGTITGLLLRRALERARNETGPGYRDPGPERGGYGI